MGNVLRALCRWFCKPTDGVSALQDDLQNFENTSQVPKGLNNHVISSKEAQANCYRNLVMAWKKAKPPPRTAEEASFLLIQTLKRDVLADIEGFLEFYGLLHLSAEIPASLPEGVQFEMLTLPVDAKAVGDGDGMTVYVNTSSPRESKSIPREVVLLAELRSEARAVRDYRCSDALHQNIVDSGYRVLYIQREEILARKYRIRLRGIDAPELAMAYGHKAKDALIKLVQGKCLRVFVYGEDRFGRVVCDAYCNGIFVQEVLLKKGLAWHHKVYDKRVEFANWEKEARGKGVGLWASSNPDKPWEWKRKNKRE